MRLNNIISFLSISIPFISITLPLTRFATGFPVHLPHQPGIQSMRSTLSFLQFYRYIPISHSSARSLHFRSAAPSLKAAPPQMLSDATSFGMGEQNAKKQKTVLSASSNKIIQGDSDSKITTPFLEKSKVIVIAGPTACGKSELALTLCELLGGELISADSVQVYEDLQVGANKPSPAELARAPHHLVGSVPLDRPFTAGDFLRAAKAAIDDVLARGKVPVVCGGTMMYVQWLVLGSPDAPKSDAASAARAAALLRPHRDRGDWEGGLAELASRHPGRAARLGANDWYRLDRALQIVLTHAAQADASQNGQTPDEEKKEDTIFTGDRETFDEFDFRSFFLIGDREPLAHRIDSRCVAMLRGGLLEEVGQLAVAGQLGENVMAAKAIGYRQTLDYLCRSDFQPGDKAAFLEFFNEFTKATRNYATAQMKWYRKDPHFAWLKTTFPGEGEGEGEGGEGGGEERPAAAAAGAVAAAAAALLAEEVLRGYRLGPADFRERVLGAPAQAALREENLRQGKRMKRFATRGRLAEAEVAALVATADGFARRLSGARGPGGGGGDDGDGDGGGGGQGPASSSVTASRCGTGEEEGKEDTNLA